MEIGAHQEIPHCVCATAALVKLKYHIWHKQKMIYGPSAIRLHCSPYTFSMYFMPCRSTFTVIRSNLARSARTRPNCRHNWTWKWKIDMHLVLVCVCGDGTRDRSGALQLNYVVHNFRWSMHVLRHFSQTKTPRERVYHSLILWACARASWCALAICHWSDDGTRNKRRIGESLGSRWVTESRTSSIPIIPFYTFDDTHHTNW